MNTTIDHDILDEIVSLRRDLHRHPELSWEEHRTARQVCAFLERHGIPYRDDVAGTGVVAELPGAEPGPVVALRADLDALPIHEETGLPFASIHDGCMHACGHDAHTAMLLGAAAMLTRNSDLPVPVRFIFQPAEERGLGAKAMIDAGVLDGVGMIFGGHVDRHFPTGTIAVTDGPVNASTDAFQIRVTGQSAHAARPHEGIDAVVVAMLIVSAIQTIVSREVNPAHPSVVTVGRVVAGTAANVIAGEALLEGTVRAQEPAVRKHLVASVERMARAAGQLHEAQIEFEILGNSPPVVNPPELCVIAREAAGTVVGTENVRRMEMANIGAEDFGNFMEIVPGCYVRFGSRVAGRESYPAHSSRFEVDEGVLPVGAAFFTKIARLAATEIAPRAASSV